MKIFAFIIIYIKVKTHANGRNRCQQLPTLLGVVGQQCGVCLHEPKSLTGFKLYATSANKCQHCCGSMQRTQQGTTLLGPTMLGVVGQQCWVCLRGPLGVKGAPSGLRGGGGQSFCAGFFLISFGASRFFLANTRLARFHSHIFNFKT